MVSDSQVYVESEPLRTCILRHATMQAVTYRQIQLLLFILFKLNLENLKTLLTMNMSFKNLSCTSGIS